jgi:hypothetical protein
MDSQEKLYDVQQTVEQRGKARLKEIRAWYRKDKFFEGKLNDNGVTVTPKFIQLSFLYSNPLKYSNRLKKIRMDYDRKSRALLRKVAYDGLQVSEVDHYCPKLNKPIAIEFHKNGKIFAKARYQDSSAKFKSIKIYDEIGKVKVFITNRRDQALEEFNYLVDEALRDKIEAYCKDKKIFDRKPS